MLAGARPAEIVIADLQPQGRLLDLGSGLSGELADMAAAMESQQVLVRRGEELGIPVRVIAHPTADVEEDLVELVRVLASAGPRGLVGRPVARRRARRRWTARPPSSPQGTTPFPTGAAVSVAWSADSNGEAAVVLGARLAVARQVALQLPAEGGRRLGAVRAALEERGVRVAEPATPDPDSGLCAAVIDVAGYGAACPVDRRQERAGRRTRRLHHGRARRSPRRRVARAVVTGSRPAAGAAWRRYSTTEGSLSCCCPRAC